MQMQETFRALKPMRFSVCLLNCVTDSVQYHRRMPKVSLKSAFGWVASLFLATAVAASGQSLHLIAPTNAIEALGPFPEPARVFLSQTSPAPVVVKLTAHPILQVPATVTIPAGRSSAEFNVSVGDDSLYSQLDAWVRASADGWASGQAVIRIADNEDGSFTVVAPKVIYEGVPAEAVVTFATPRHSDTAISLARVHGRVNHPDMVTLRAGETSARIPLLFAEAGWAEFSVVAPDTGFSRLVHIITAKNDPNIQGLWMKLENGSTHFVGGAVELGAVLGVSYDWPQNTNAVGELRLIDRSGQHDFAPREIQFTNGVWSGSFAFDHAGTGLIWEITAAGFTKQSLAFDVVPGASLVMKSLDIAHHASGNLLLVSEGPVTNAAGRLLGLSTLDFKAPLKSINLPTPAHSISVGEDGAAWLAMTSQRAQKVDLAAWTLGDSIPVSQNPADVLLEVLALGAGQCAAVVAPSSRLGSQTRITLFVDGVVAFSRPIPQPNQLWEVRFVQLFRGRSETEFFLLTDQKISRYDFSGGTLAVQEGDFAASSEAHFGNDTIYYPSGWTLDAGTFAASEPPSPQFFGVAALMPIPGSSRLLGVSGDELILYGNDRRRLASMPLGGIAGQHSPLQALCWTNGVAVRTAERVLLLNPPLISTGRADLELRFAGPATVTNIPGNEPFFYDWEFEIVNHGPDVATHVGLTGWTEQVIGTLGVGEARHVTAGAGLWPAAAFSQAQMWTFSVQEDPNTANNTALAATRVIDAENIDGFYIPMNVLSLASSRDRQKLYASFNSMLGEPTPGIAVIDPVAGSVLRHWGTQTPATEIAVSGDGEFLFSNHGELGILRWNLRTGETNAMGGGSAGSFFVAGADSDQILVSDREFLSLFRGLNPVGDPIRFPAAPVRLELDGDNLWAVTEGEANRYSVSPSGLIRNAGPFAPLSQFGNYDFAADSKRLYFQGELYEFATRQMKPWPPLWTVAFPEADVVVGFDQEHAAIFAQSDLSLLGSELLVARPTGKFTRILERGVAYSSDYRLIVQNLGIPAGGLNADLGVSIKAPPSYGYAPVEWEIAVTNHSAAPALDARLMLETSANVRWLAVEGGQAMLRPSSASVRIGNVAQNASQVIRLRAVVSEGETALKAGVISRSPDPNTGNNTASSMASFHRLPGDITLTYIGPERAALGAEVNIDFVAHNPGPLAAPNLFFFPKFGDGAVALNGEIAPFSLSVGETKTISMRLKFTLPGLVEVSALLSATNDLPVYYLRRSGALVYVDQPGVPIERRVFPQSPLLDWNNPGQELVAMFSGVLPKVYGLDANTYEPRWNVALDGMSLGFVPPYVTSDARYVWLALDNGILNRVNLETKQVDMRISAPEGAFLRALISPIGRPDVALVGYSSADGSELVTAAYRSGMRLPRTVASAGFLTSSPEGRIFMMSPSAIFELKLVEDGVEEAQRFAGGGAWPWQSISVFGGRIYHSNGGILDVATGVSGGNPGGAQEVTVDPVSGQLYRATMRDVTFGPTHRYEKENLSTGTVEWRIGREDISRLLPLGTNGVMLVGSRNEIINPTPPASADLAISAEVPAEVKGPNVDFSIAIVVTNHTPWVMTNGSVVISLPDDAVVRDPFTGQWFATNRHEFVIGDVFGGSANSLGLRFTNTGPHQITVSVAGNLPESNTANNSAMVTTTVLPLPQVLIDDFAMLESPLALNGTRVWLSAPAPRRFDVSYRVEPILGEAADVTSLTGSFTIPQGARSGQLRFLASDNIPELAETFRIELTSPELIFTRTFTTATVLNDDFPRLFVLGTTNREGNAGISQAIVRLSVQNPAPFPTEVSYTTVSDTAISGADFVQTSGRVRFEPFESTKAVSIDLIGNTIFSADKQFSVLFSEPLNIALNDPPVATVTIRNDDLPPAFDLSITRSGAQGVITLQFVASTGVRYELQQRLTLDANRPWGLVPGLPLINGTNGRFVLVEQTPRFYQVRATVPASP